VSIDGGGGWCLEATPGGEVIASILNGVIWAVAGTWLFAGILLARARHLIPTLGDVASAAAPATTASTAMPDAALPTLTVIAAARDEAARVEGAARSLLAQDYPGIQVVVVDDRSVDGTATILDRLAAESPRLRVLHVRALPDGWLGKSHALALAAKEAKTDWLLFTDGDVTLAPDATRSAVSLALQEGADHLAVAPSLIIRGIGEAAFTGYFVVMFHLSQQPWRARDPGSPQAVGIGAFNLVRRDAYERAGGHEGIRFEMIDDLALGKSLKGSGARQFFALDGGRVRARWQEGVGGLIRGVEKNAFAVLHYNVAIGILAVLSQLLISTAPIFGLFVPDPFAKGSAIAAWVGVALAYRAATWNGRYRWIQAVLMPLGGVLFAYAILRSIVLGVTRGGIYWRGTFYPLDRLRRGGAG